MGYSGKTILPNVCLDIHHGDSLGILGPNGAGKTTLLKTLLSIIPPVKGKVSYPEGRDRVRFGYVPQRQVVDETYPLTVGEVVIMGCYGRLRPGQKPAKNEKNAMIAALDDVGLPDLIHKPYRELSGGQKQRVLIARALTGKPTVLVLDEPTTDMDIKSERNVVELIRHLHNNQNLTIIVVSHLLHIVLSLSKNVAFVNKNVMTLPVEDAREPKVLSDFYETPVCVENINGYYVAI